MRGIHFFYLRYGLDTEKLQYINKVLQFRSRIIKELNTNLSPYKYELELIDKTKREVAELLKK